MTVSRQLTLEDTLMNSLFLDNLMTYIENFNPEAKLDLISKLAQSLKKGVIPKENRMYSSFGVWVEDSLPDNDMGTFIWS